MHPKTTLVGLLLLTQGCAYANREEIVTNGRDFFPLMMWTYREKYGIACSERLFMISWDYKQQVAEIVRTLEKSNQTKKCLSKVQFFIFHMQKWKSDKSAKCLKNRPKSRRFSPCFLQCSWVRTSAPDISITRFFSKSGLNLSSFCSTHLRTRCSFWAHTILVWWFIGIINKISGWIFTIIGWLFSQTAAIQLCSNTL